MLSKSKLIAYRQCPKRLWLSKHRPELATESGQAKARFEMGNSVGQVAQQLYGPGELVFDNQKPDFEAAIRRTSELIEKGEGTLFEATFRADSALVMADVVQLTPEGARVIEVKSATSVTDYYLDDCAVQTHVMRKAGLNVAQVQIAHVDSSFVYQGKGYEGLFKVVDVAEEIAPRVEQIPAWIEGAIRTLKGEQPDIRPGKHCTKPFECPFHGHCNPQRTEYPIENMPKLRKKQVKALSAQGIIDIRDIPEAELEGPEQLQFYRAVKSGTPFLDPDAGTAIRALPYPRYYLDFETLGPAVPQWIGTRPHQASPFQWSLHIEKAPGQMEHAAFLAPSTTRYPGREAMLAMLQCIGTSGPVLVYTGYEKSVLTSMAKMCPDLAVQLVAVIQRLFDLHPVLKKGFYHRDMQGSWSIKAILPTIAPGLRYDALEKVQNGLAAQDAYKESMLPTTSPERREQLRQRLLDYCELDTRAMVAVAEYLSAAP